MNDSTYTTDNIDNLKALEDDTTVVKKKTKKNHKLAEDDFFYRIKIPYNQSSAIFKTKNPAITKGMLVVIPTVYGNEIGICQGQTSNMEEIQYQDNLQDIVRVATEKDKVRHAENIKKEVKAFDVTKKKILEHKLDMKLISAHYFLEDSKILFNFTSDGRVDFRELVKDLASIFKTRIELRQIGVRDECRIISSYGQCGKHLCCGNVLNDLTPITIKMAKEQNITLNSQKISGTCGRLLCCLSYEFNAYMDEKKDYPREGSKIFVNQEPYIVTEINIQTKKVRAVAEKGTEPAFVVLDRKQLKREKNTYSATVEL